MLRTLHHQNIIKLEEILTEKSEMQSLVAQSDSSPPDVWFVFEFVPYDLVGILAQKLSYSVD